MTHDLIFDHPAVIFCCTLTIRTHLNKTGETGFFLF